MEDWMKMIEILGKDNTDRIKSAIADALIENVTWQIQEYSIGDISERFDLFVEEIFQDCLEELKAKYKDGIVKMFEDNIPSIMQKYIEEQTK